MPRGRAFRFIATPTDQDPTTREFHRTVRSHAASVSRPERIIRRRARTRGGFEGEGVIEFDAQPVDATGGDNSENLPAAATTGELTTVSRRTPPGYDRGQPFDPNRLTVNYLSGRTFSPLQHLATYHKPYLPGIVNHYICNLTIPIPELDGNSAVPLFRAAWLPIVFHDPVVFQVVILFAATHYATFADSSQFDRLHLELLSLKQAALRALINRVQNEQTAPPISANRDRGSRDTLIAAAAKMASYEAIFGTSEAFHLHMSTVTRLLRLEGGLAALGMDGFLARLLSFIDTNSAFLLGTRLHLVEYGVSNSMPHHQPFLPRRLDEVAPQAYQRTRDTNVINLERFIGLINVNSQNDEGT